MNTKSVDAPKSLIKQQVLNLETTVIELVALCNKLSKENATYRGSNKQLMLERSELQTKNNKVRGQVEAMVLRLKALD